VEGKGKEREEVERWGNASSLQGDKGPWKMTVVTVGKNTVEQTVISFAAQSVYDGRWGGLNRLRSLRRMKASIRWVLQSPTMHAHEP